MEGVEYAFVETARSDDLFNEKQFGGFGEATILTLLVSDSQKEKVFNALQTFAAWKEMKLDRFS